MHARIFGPNHVARLRAGFGVLKPKQSGARINRREWFSVRVLDRLSENRDHFTCISIAAHRGVLLFDPFQNLSARCVRDRFERAHAITAETKDERYCENENENGMHYPDDTR